jgi:hypothetical protein
MDDADIARAFTIANGTGGFLLEGTRSDPLDQIDPITASRLRLIWSHVKK